MFSKVRRARCAGCGVLVQTVRSLRPGPKSAIRTELGLLNRLKAPHAGQ